MPIAYLDKHNGYVRTVPYKLPSFEELKEESKDIEGTVKAKRLGVDEAIYKRPTRPRDERKFLATYGISVYQYEEMFYAQGGKCAICKREESNGKLLATDHCHKTGKVRGLLCGSCNRGLGFFVDSIPRLLAALEYLRNA